MNSMVADPTDCKLLCCHLGEDRFALSPEYVRGIYRAEHLRRSADRSDAVGQLDLERPTPVFSLAQSLGRLVPTVQPGQAVVVLQTAQGGWGLLVDRVEHLTVPSSSRLVMSNFQRTLSLGPVNGMVKQNDTTLLLLEPDELHPDADRCHKWTSLERSRPGSQRTPANKQSTNQQRLLTFTATVSQPHERPLLLGASVSQVAEVLDQPEIHKVPNAPDVVLGMVHWRTRVVLLLDVPSLLGLPNDALGDDQSRLLIMRTAFEGQSFAIRVRRDIGVMRLPLAHIPCRRQLPLNLQFVHQVLELHQGILVVPDWNRFASLSFASD